MKKNIIYTFFAAMAMCTVFTACSEDPLSDTSIIKDSQREENDFDRWIMSTYTTPYNIDIKYRMEDIESDQNYNLIPAAMNKSIMMSKIIDYLCLQTYDEVTGSKEFMRTYFPKILHMVGSGAYNNNGTYVAGTAEGGLKITFYDLNNLNINNLTQFNDNYMKVVFHEFSHILHQTKPYEIDFKEISGSDYISDSWSSNYPSEDKSLPDGFISPYSSKAADEDFVEIIAHYIICTPEMWAKKMEKAGATGLPILNAKFELVYNYLQNTWNLNLDALREVFHRREADLGNIDLNNI